MHSALKHSLPFLLAFLAATVGCSVGGSGWSLGLGFYMDPGPGGGYSGPPSDLPYGALGCEITHPAYSTRVDWEQTIWIYGVVWREGMSVDAYAWDGPEWEVDGGLIGEGYYQYDQWYPEIWVRFPFDGRAIGPGNHEVTLKVWDLRGGHPFCATDSIYLYVE